MLSTEKRRFGPSAVVRNPWQGVAPDSWAMESSRPATRTPLAPRYSFRADLEIEWGSTVLRGSTRDISSSGMFIEAIDPLWLVPASPRG